VNKLWDRNNALESGGTGMGHNDEHWFRLSINGKSKEDLTFCLMHELVEYDFWEKTKPGDTEAEVKSTDEINAFKADDLTYQNLLDEKIANRRALKAVRRMWPFAHFDNPDMIYGEDK